MAPVSGCVMRFFTVSGRKFASGLSALFLVSLGFDATAHAASCSSLRAELASLSSGSASAGKYDRYDSAYRKQITELRKTEAMAQRPGCARTKTAQCTSLNSMISRMKSNAAKLKSTRDRYRSTGNVAANRRQIEARLKANGCNRQVLFPKNNKKKTSTTRTIVTKRTTKSERKVAAVATNRSVRNHAQTPPTPPSSLAAGGYRMMCVRLCDGYFFPMGFTTDAPQWKEGQQACDSLCPGAQSRVFVHRLPDQETEQMADANGQPYSDLQTAFSYLEPGHLKQRASACSCRGAANPQIPKATPVPSGLLHSVETDDGTKTALPAIRPDLFADPETRTNRATGMTFELYLRLTRAPARGEAVEIVRNDDVRVVLPEFLPAPEEAIDLQAPGPSVFR